MSQVPSNRACVRAAHPPYPATPAGLFAGNSHAGHLSRFPGPVAQAQALRRHNRTDGKDTPDGDA